MSELVAETLELAAPVEAIWAIVDDPDALGRVLPGAESIVAEGGGRFRGVLASRIGFVTVRADVVAEVADAEPPGRFRLAIDGRPRGLAGSFRASVPVELEPLGADRTRVRYRVDLSVTGRLAAFGAPLLRDALRRQVGDLVRNVEAEAARRGSR